MRSEGMTIGKLARTAGVNVETIRYYQRRRLLDRPARPPSGYRRYDAEQLKRLRFIKRAQALGFTLSEIAALLRLDGARVCGETRAIAARKLDLIEGKIADLEAMKRALRELVRRCETAGATAACPIIDALSNG